MFIVNVNLMSMINEMSIFRSLEKVEILMFNIKKKRSTIYVMKRCFIIITLFIITQIIKGVMTIKHF